MGQGIPLVRGEGLHWSPREPWGVYIYEVIIRYACSQHLEHSATCAGFGRMIRLLDSDTPSSPPGTFQRQNFPYFCKFRIHGEWRNGRHLWCWDSNLVPHKLRAGADTIDELFVRKLIFLSIHWLTIYLLIRIYMRMLVSRSSDEHHDQLRYEPKALTWGLWRLIADCCWVLNVLIEPIFARILLTTLSSLCFIQTKYGRFQATYAFSFPFHSLPFIPSSISFTAFSFHAFNVTLSTTPVWKAFSLIYMKMWLNWLVLIYTSVSIVQQCTQQSHQTHTHPTTNNAFALHHANRASVRQNRVLTRLTILFTHEMNFNLVRLTSKLTVPTHNTQHTRTQYTEILPAKTKKIKTKKEKKHKNQYETHNNQKHFN